MGKSIAVVAWFTFMLVHGKLATEEVCGDNWAYFNGHCYTWHRREAKQYNTAKEECKNVNGSLAQLEGNETRTFVRKHVLKNEGRHFWSSLHRCHSVKFYWTDDSPMVYEQFADDEPNHHEGDEDCVEMYPDSSWNDQRCSSILPIVCQNSSCSTESLSQACFYKHEGEGTWFEAQQHCKGAGDTLAKIDSSMTNFYVKNVAQSKGCWIGLRRQDYLCWVPGKMAVLRGIVGGCVDGVVDQCSCVALDEQGLWREASCISKLPYVCEKDANECRDANNACHMNAICLNTVGSYTCQCKDGFLGNGKVCTEPKDFNASLINLTNTEEVKAVIKTCSKMLDNDEQTEIVIKVLEDVTVSSGKKLNKNGEDKIIMENEDIVLGVLRVKAEGFQGLTFPDNVHELSNNQDKIVFPASIFPSGSDSAVIVGMVYDAPSVMMNSSVEDGWFVNSKIVGGIIHPDPGALLTDPVTIQFRVIKILKDVNIQCAFWKFKDGEKGTWSTDGCHVTEATATHVTCECNHLTNFAILFKVKSGLTTATENKVLDIITYVGLSASILGCFLTLIIHLYFRKLRKGRGFIHINLVIALGLADVVFLVAIFIDHGSDSCLAMAILVLYFFLALFFWMLVEGLYICLMVKKVFDITGRKIKYLYCTIGWFFPMVIVAATYGILRSKFLSDEYCWLSTESGAIWAFVGPITFIILVNVILMIVVLKLTVTMLPEESDNGKIMSAFRTFLMLTPVLGVTWVFGILTITHDSEIFQYIFAILNSFQGLIIFLFYCVLNKEARREMRRKLRAMRSNSASITRRKSSSSSKAKNTGSTKASLNSSSKKGFKESNFSETAGRYTPWYMLPKTNKDHSSGNHGFEHENSAATQPGKQIEYPMRQKCDVTGDLFNKHVAGAEKGIHEHPVPDIYPLEKSRL